MGTFKSAYKQKGLLQLENLEGFEASNTFGPNYSPSLTVSVGSTLDTTTSVIGNGSVKLLAAGASGLRNAVFGASFMTIGAVSIGDLYGAAVAVNATGAILGKSTYVDKKDPSKGMIGAAMTGNAKMVLNGTSVKNVYGAGAGAGAFLTGDVNITVNGGSINNIYGGGNKGAAMVGDVFININGNAKIGKIYAGGKASTVEGKATVTFNSLSGLEFKGTVYGTGADKKSIITGGSTLVFNGSKGEFNATINGFNEVEFLTGTSITMTKAQNKTMKTAQYSFNVSGIDSSILTLNKKYVFTNVTVTVDIDSFNGEAKDIVLVSSKYFKKVTDFDMYSIKGVESLLGANLLISVDINDPTVLKFKGGTIKYEYDKKLGGRLVLHVDGGDFNFSADTPMTEDFQGSDADKTVTIGDGASIDKNMNMGDGTDKVFFKKDSVVSGDISLEGGDDQVSVDEGVQFTGLVNLGAGKNKLTLKRGAQMDNLQLAADSESNDVIINGAAVGSIETLGGDNTFYLSGTDATRLGGIGYFEEVGDVLEFRAQTLDLRTSQGNNKVVVDAYGAVGNIFFGDGNDVLEVGADSQIGAGVDTPVVNLGRGNNTVVLRRNKIDVEIISEPNANNQIVLDTNTIALGAHTLENLSYTALVVTSGRHVEYTTSETPNVFVDGFGNFAGADGVYGGVYLSQNAILDWKFTDPKTDPKTSETKTVRMIGAYSGRMVWDGDLEIWGVRDAAELNEAFGTDYYQTKTDGVVGAEIRAMSITVREGGRVASTTLYGNGDMTLKQGASMEDVVIDLNEGAKVTLENGAEATGVTLEHGDLTAKKGSTLRGFVNVKSGNALIYGTADVDNLFVGGNLTAGKDAELSGTATVTGDATISGIANELDVAGTLTLESKATVNGDVKAGELVTKEFSALNGETIVAGTAAIAGSVYILKAADVTINFSHDTDRFLNDITVLNTLTVNADAVIDNLTLVNHNGGVNQNVIIGEGKMLTAVIDGKNVQMVNGRDEELTFDADTTVYIGGALKKDVTFNGNDVILANYKDADNNQPRILGDIFGSANITVDEGIVTFFDYGQFKNIDGIAFQVLTSALLAFDGVMDDAQKDALVKSVGFAENARLGIGSDIYVGDWIGTLDIASELGSNGLVKKDGQLIKEFKNLFVREGSKIIGYVEGDENANIVELQEGVTVDGTRTTYDYATISLKEGDDILTLDKGVVINGGVDMGAGNDTLNLKGGVVINEAVNQLQPAVTMDGGKVNVEGENTINGTLTGTDLQLNIAKDAVLNVKELSHTNSQGDLDLQVYGKLNVQEGGDTLSLGGKSVDLKLYGDASVNKENFVFNATERAYLSVATEDSVPGELIAKDIRLTAASLARLSVSKSMDGSVSSSLEAEDITLNANGEAGIAEMNIVGSLKAKSLEAFGDYVSIVGGDDGSLYGAGKVEIANDLTLDIDGETSKRIGIIYMDINAGHDIALRDADNVSITDSALEAGNAIVVERAQQVEFKATLDGGAREATSLTASEIKVEADGLNVEDSNITAKAGNIEVDAKSTVTQSALTASQDVLLKGGAKLEASTVKAEEGSVKMLGDGNDNIVGAVVTPSSVTEEAVIGGATVTDAEFLALSGEGSTVTAGEDVMMLGGKKNAIVGSEVTAGKSVVMAAQEKNAVIASNVTAVEGSLLMVGEDGAAVSNTIIGNVKVTPETGAALVNDAILTRAGREGGLEAANAQIMVGEFVRMEGATNTVAFADINAGKAVQLFGEDNTVAHSTLGADEGNVEIEGNADVYGSKITAAKAVEIGKASAAYDVTVEASTITALDGDIALRGNATVAADAVLNTAKDLYIGAENASNTVDAVLTAENGNVTVEGANNTVTNTVTAGNDVTIGQSNAYNSISGALTAENGNVDVIGAYNTVTNTVTAGTDVTIGEAGANNSISGALTAENGNVDVVGAYNTVTSTVNALTDVTIGEAGAHNSISGALTAENGNVDVVGAYNTVTSTVTAGNDVTIGQADAVNSISGDVNAVNGNVTIEGVTNTVTSTVTAGTNVAIGQAGATNSISGDVNAVNGNVTIEGAANTVTSTVNAQSIVMSGNGTNTIVLNDGNAITAETIDMTAGQNNSISYDVSFEQDGGIADEAAQSASISGDLTMNAKGENNLKMVVEASADGEYADGLHKHAELNLGKVTLTQSGSIDATGESNNIKVGLNLSAKGEANLSLEGADVSVAGEGENVTMNGQNNTLDIGVDLAAEERSILNVGDAVVNYTADKTTMLSDGGKNKLDIQSSVVRDENSELTLGNVSVDVKTDVVMAGAGAENELTIAGENVTLAGSIRMGSDGLSSDPTGVIGDRLSKSNTATINIASIEDVESIKMVAESNALDLNGEGTIEGLGGEARVKLYGASNSIKLGEGVTVQGDVKFENYIDNDGDGMDGQEDDILVENKSNVLIAKGVIDGNVSSDKVTSDDTFVFAKSVGNVTTGNSLEKDVVVLKDGAIARDITMGKDGEVNAGSNTLKVKDASQAGVVQMTGKANKAVLRGTIEIPVTEEGEEPAEPIVTDATVASLSMAATDSNTLKAKFAAINGDATMTADNANTAKLDNTAVADALTMDAGTDNMLNSNDLTVGGAVTLTANGDNAMYLGKAETGALTMQAGNDAPFKYSKGDNTVKSQGLTVNGDAKMNATGDNTLVNTWGEGVVVEGALTMQADGANTVKANSLDVAGDATLQGRGGNTVKTRELTIGGSALMESRTANTIEARTLDITNDLTMNSAYPMQMAGFNQVTTDGGTIGGNVTMTARNTNVINNSGKDYKLYLNEIGGNLTAVARKGYNSMYIGNVQGNAELYAAVAPEALGAEEEEANAEEVSMERPEPYNYIEADSIGGNLVAKAVSYNAATIYGDVNGNVTLDSATATNTLKVDNVGGDLSATAAQANDVIVNGDVTRNVTLTSTEATNTLIVANVGGDLSAEAGVSNDVTVNGDVTGNVTLDAYTGDNTLAVKNVGGDLSATASQTNDVKVEGSVTGDVSVTNVNDLTGEGVTDANTVNLLGGEEGATIGGSLIVTANAENGDNTVNTDNVAIAGDVTVTAGDDNWVTMNKTAVGGDMLVDNRDINTVTLKDSTVSGSLKSISADERKNFEDDLSTLDLTRTTVGTLSEEGPEEALVAGDVHETIPLEDREALADRYVKDAAVAAVNWSGSNRVSLNGSTVNGDMSAVASDNNAVQVVGDITESDEEGVSGFISSVVKGDLNVIATAAAGTNEVNICFADVDGTVNVQGGSNAIGASFANVGGIRAKAGTADNTVSLNSMAVANDVSVIAAKDNEVTLTAATVNGVVAAFSKDGDNTINASTSTIGGIKAEADEFENITLVDTVVNGKVNAVARGNADTESDVSSLNLTRTIVNNGAAEEELPEETDTVEGSEAHGKFSKREQRQLTRKAEQAAASLVSWNGSNEVSLTGSTVNGDAAFYASDNNSLVIKSDVTWKKKEAEVPEEGGMEEEELTGRRGHRWLDTHERVQTDTVVNGSVDVYAKVGNNRADIENATINGDVMIEAVKGSNDLTAKADTIEGSVTLASGTVNTALVKDSTIGGDLTADAYYVNTNNAEALGGEEDSKEEVLRDYDNAAAKNDVKVLNAEIGGSLVMNAFGEHSVTAESVEELSYSSHQPSSNTAFVKDSSIGQNVELAAGGANTLRVVDGTVEGMVNVIQTGAGHTDEEFSNVIRLKRTVVNGTAADEPTEEVEFPRKDVVPVTPVMPYVPVTPVDPENPAIYGFRLFPAEVNEDANMGLKVITKRGDADVQLDGSTVNNGVGVFATDGDNFVKFLVDGTKVETLRGEEDAEAEEKVLPVATTVTGDVVISSAKDDNTVVAAGAMFDGNVSIFAGDSNDVAFVAGFAGQTVGMLNGTVSEITTAASEDTTGLANDVTGSVTVVAGTSNNVFLENNVISQNVNVVAGAVNYLEIHDSSVTGAVTALAHAENEIYVKGSEIGSFHAVMDLKAAANPVIPKDYYKDYYEDNLGEGWYGDYWYNYNDNNLYGVTVNGNVQADMTVDGDFYKKQSLVVAGASDSYLPWTVFGNSLDISGHWEAIGEDDYVLKTSVVNEDVIMSTKMTDVEDRPMEQYNVTMFMGTETVPDFTAHISVDGVNTVTAPVVDGSFAALTDGVIAENYLDVYEGSVVKGNVKQAAEGKVMNSLDVWGEVTPAAAEDADKKSPRGKALFQAWKPEEEGGEQKDITEQLHTIAAADVLPTVIEGGIEQTATVAAEGSSLSIRSVLYRANSVTVVFPAAEPGPEPMEPHESIGPEPLEPHPYESILGPAVESVGTPDDDDDDDTPSVTTNVDWQEFLTMNNVYLGRATTVGGGVSQTADFGDNGLEVYAGDYIEYFDRVTGEDGEKKLTNEPVKVVDLSSTIKGGISQKTFGANWVEVDNGSLVVDGEGVPGVGIRQSQNWQDKDGIIDANKVFAIDGAGTTITVRQDGGTVSIGREDVIPSETWQFTWAQRKQLFQSQVAEFRSLIRDGEALQNRIYVDPSATLSVNGDISQGSDLVFARLTEKGVDSNPDFFYSLDGYLFQKDYQDGKMVYRAVADGAWDGIADLSVDFLMATTVNQITAWGRIYANAVTQKGITNTINVYAGTYTTDLSDVTGNPADYYYAKTPELSVFGADSVSQYGKYNTIRSESDDTHGESMAAIVVAENFGGFDTAFTYTNTKVWAGKGRSFTSYRNSSIVAPDLKGGSITQGSLGTLQEGEENIMHNAQINESALAHQNIIANTKVDDDTSTDGTSWFFSGDISQTVEDHAELRKDGKLAEEPVMNSITLAAYANMDVETGRKRYSWLKADYVFNQTGTITQQALNGLNYTVLTGTNVVGDIAQDASSIKVGAGLDSHYTGDMGLYRGDNYLDAAGTGLDDEHGAVTFAEVTGNISQKSVNGSNTAFLTAVDVNVPAEDAEDHAPVEFTQELTASARKASLMNTIAIRGLDEEADGSAFSQVYANISQKADAEGRRSKASLLNTIEVTSADIHGNIAQENARMDEDGVANDILLENTAMVSNVPSVKDELVVNGEVTGSIAQVAQMGDNTLQVFNMDLNTSAKPADPLPTGDDDEEQVPAGDDDEGTVVEPVEALMADDDEEPLPAEEEEAKVVAVSQETKNNGSNFISYMGGITDETDDVSRGGIRAQEVVKGKHWSFVTDIKTSMGQVYGDIEQTLTDNSVRGEKEGNFLEAQWMDQDGSIRQTATATNEYDREGAATNVALNKMELGTVDFNEYYNRLSFTEGRPSNALGFDLEMMVVEDGTHSGTEGYHPDPEGTRPYDLPGSDAHDDVSTVDGTDVDTVYEDFNASNLSWKLVKVVDENGKFLLDEDGHCQMKVVVTYQHQVSDDDDAPVSTLILEKKALEPVPAEILGLDDDGDDDEGEGDTYQLSVKDQEKVNELFDYLEKNGLKRRVKISGNVEQTVSNGDNTLEAELVSIGGTVSQMIEENGDNTIRLGDTDAYTGLLVGTASVEGATNGLLDLAINVNGNTTSVTAPYAPDFAVVDGDVNQIIGTGVGMVSTYHEGVTGRDSVYERFNGLGSAPMLNPAGEVICESGLYEAFQNLGDLNPEGATVRVDYNQLTYLIVVSNTVGGYVIGTYETKNGDELGDKAGWSLVSSGVESVPSYYEHTAINGNNDLLATYAYIKGNVNQVIGTAPVPEEPEETEEEIVISEVAGDDEGVEEVVFEAGSNSVALLSSMVDGKVNQTAYINGVNNIVVADDAYVGGSLNQANNNAFDEEGNQYQAVNRVALGLGKAEKAAEEAAEVPEGFEAVENPASVTGEDAKDAPSVTIMGDADGIAISQAGGFVENEVKALQADIRGDIVQTVGEAAEIGLLSKLAEGLEVGVSNDLKLSDCRFTADADVVQTATSILVESNDPEADAGFGRSERKIVDNIQVDTLSGDDDDDVEESEELPLNRWADATNWVDVRTNRVKDEGHSPCRFEADGMLMGTSFVETFEEVDPYQTAMGVVSQSGNAVDNFLFAGSDKLDDGTFAAERTVVLDGSTLTLEDGILILADGSTVELSGGTGLVTGGTGVELSGGTETVMTLSGGTMTQADGSTVDVTGATLSGSTVVLADGSTVTSDGMVQLPGSTTPVAATVEGMKLFSIAGVKQETGYGVNYVELWNTVVQCKDSVYALDENGNQKLDLNGAPIILSLGTNSVAIEQHADAPDFILDGGADVAPCYGYNVLYLDNVEVQGAVKAEAAKDIAYGGSDMKSVGFALAIMGFNRMAGPYSDSDAMYYNDSLGEMVMKSSIGDMYDVCAQLDWSRMLFASLAAVTSADIGMGYDLSSVFMTGSTAGVADKSVFGNWAELGENTVVGPKNFIGGETEEDGTTVKNTVAMDFKGSTGLIIGMDSVAITHGSEGSGYPVIGGTWTSSAATVNGDIQITANGDNLVYIGREGTVNGNITVSKASELEVEYVAGDFIEINPYGSTTIIVRGNIVGGNIETAEGDDLVFLASENFGTTVDEKGAPVFNVIDTGAGDDIVYLHNCGGNVTIKLGEGDDTYIAHYSVALEGGGVGEYGLADLCKALAGDEGSLYDLTGVLTPNMEHITDPLEYNGIALDFSKIMSGKNIGVDSVDFGTGDDTAINLTAKKVISIGSITFLGSNSVNSFERSADAEEGDTLRLVLGLDANGIGNLRLTGNGSAADELFKVVENITFDIDDLGTDQLAINDVLFDAATGDQWGVGDGLLAGMFYAGTNVMTYNGALDGGKGAYTDGVYMLVRKEVKDGGGRYDYIFTSNPV